MKTTALKELKSLDENCVYSLAKIEWWLMKYDEYYKDLKSYWYCQNRDCLMKITNHCSCNNKTDEFKFLNIFEELYKLCEFRRNEDYFKNELQTYYKIKDNPKKLKELIIRNEQIGANEGYDFFIGYIKYSTNPKFVQASNYYFKDFDIFIDKAGFENTITFLTIFSVLFWEDEIYPESEILLSIEKEMAESRPEILDDYTGREYFEDVDSSKLI